MKKTLKKALSIILAIISIFSCMSIITLAVDENTEEHTHTWDVYSQRESTCVMEGKIVYICAECGSTKEERFSKADHDFEENWTYDYSPCMVLSGSGSFARAIKSRHCKNCDERTDITEVPTILHINETDDHYCDACGGDLTGSCLCACHRNDSFGRFWRILIFFQKIFGQNKVCACGMKH